MLRNGAIRLHGIAAGRLRWPADPWRLVLWSGGALLAGVLALLLGGAIAIGFYAVPALLAALLVGAVFLRLPDRHAVLLLMAVVLLLQGTVGYYSGFAQISWLAYGLAGLFAVKLGARLLAPRPRRAAPPWVWPLLAFAAVVLLGVLINRPPLPQLIAGVKNQLPFWLVALYLPLARLDDRDWSAIWRFLLLVLVCQVPLVLHQHFFIAAGRAVMGWDAVVGSFGGNPDAGGLNAVMVLYTVVATLLVIALYLDGRIPLRRALAYGVCALLVILLGEVKAAFLWLPLGVLLLLGKRLIRNPAQLLLALLGLGLFVAIVGTVYERLYWADAPQKGLSENAEHSVDYFFDPKLIDNRTGEVSRGASIALWLNDRTLDTYGRWLGNGIGSSVSGAISSGTVAKRYAPLDIGSTGIAVLLWDYGILGLLCYIGLFLTAIGAAWRAVATAIFPNQQRLIAAVLVLCLMTLIYNRTLIDEPATQLLVALAFGYLSRGLNRASNDA
ncbi:hypothetical protein [Jeongeupia sp. USM3]|uniref:hypothetical protein n=1 Tax=Jeongeupia sp. USM3 TaxID=1906741 RepID=UPI00089DE44E|nr:hypothetical protein [Jeongeupia sp. USM3]AOY01889.1 hypothetical protein BJP62_16415 [Jeongeupia sp. USM3]